MALTFPFRILFLQHIAKQPVLAGFNNTGVAPFRPAKIRKRAAESLGKEVSVPDQFSQEVVNASIKLINRTFQNPTTERKAKRRRFDDISMCDPSTFISRAVSSGRSIQPPAKCRKTKEKVAIDRAFTNSERKCVIEGCNHKFYGGKGWIQCLSCQRRICPQHPKSVSDQHLKDCGDDGEIDVVGLDGEEV